MLGGGAVAVAVTVIAAAAAAVVATPAMALVLESWPRLPMLVTDWLSGRGSTIKAEWLMPDAQAGTAQHC